MNTHRIQKWGNSLAIRIPKPLAAQVGFKNQTPVTIEVSEGSIVVSPQSEANMQLSQMVDKINQHNIHNEIDFGIKQGRESW
ncbi:MAG: AbrB/MazE/SpoVT family DNA-binding domain-containing protein [Candidatus Atribacteria bacterium]|nr:AbrB/MazE/SpoVT family DNA-binding domain-containing protein [Candidatus Atribacteria bacterium]